MKITKLFTNFFNSEKSGGIILIIATLFSLIAANSSWGAQYTGFWETQFAGHSIAHWVNDGLMAIFFLLIGLELEREVYQGELSNLKDAALPLVAALGGIIIPAGIYIAFNYGTTTQDGAGIPMATDIAFALGVLSLLGNKVPASLKVFLVALAVIDDLCAILVIAIFYSKGIDTTSLFTALGIFALLLAFNRLKIRNLIPYLIGGVALWYFMLHSGVHATISGVLLAFAIPFGNGDEKSTSYILQNALHYPVAFLILPIFALANTAIPINGSITAIMTQPYALGIALGLLVGKPLGVTLFSYFTVKMKWASLPEGIEWKHIIGLGLLAAIGFTMSIFITLLAFTDGELISNAKLVIMITSLVAGLSGYFLLRKVLK